MIVLDTNVVSETMRRTPNPAVVGWLDTQPASDLYICAPVLAELSYGMARLVNSRRKAELLRAYSQIVAQMFEGRFLPFDAQAAEAYGELVAELERAGRSIDVMDAMIAATALTYSATLATRNTEHFRHTGVALLNPFVET
jgi:predicted nucleic acid-binding protein